MVRLSRRRDYARCLTEADGNRAGTLTTAALDGFITVLQESAGLAVRQAQWILPGRGELHHGARGIGRRAGERAGTEDVTRAQIAAVGSVMRNHLCGGPVRVACVASRQPLRRFRTGGPKMHLEDDVESAGFFVPVIQQVRQWQRIACGAAKRFAAKRLE